MRANASNDDVEEFGNEEVKGLVFVGPGSNSVGVQAFEA